MKLSEVIVGSGILGSQHSGPREKLLGYYRVFSCGVKASQAHQDFATIGVGALQRRQEPFRFAEVAFVQRFLGSAKLRLRPRARGCVAGNLWLSTEAPCSTGEAKVRHQEELHQS